VNGLPALPIRQVLESVYAAPQLDPAAMAVAAAMGFKSVINNRPDFEHGPGQPANADIAAAAEAAGLSYCFLPVSGSWQSPEQIGELARLLDEMPKPILLFCRSGARSARMALAVQAQL
jgi:uncharacterized protein (TIGR01244 family)